MVLPQRLHRASCLAFAKRELATVAAGEMYDVDRRELPVAATLEPSGNFQPYDFGLG